MRHNNIFPPVRPNHRKQTPARRRGVVGFAATLALLGLLPSVQAQRGPATIGTPVSPDYQGLRTTNSYQPLPLAGADGVTNTPPPIHVVPIDDELRRSYRLDPFYKKTLTSVGVVIVGSERVSDWAFLEAAYTLDHQLHNSPAWSGMP